MHGHGDPAHGIRGAAAVVSAELRLSPAVAAQKVTTACELVGELPATVSELAAGDRRLPGPDHRRTDLPTRAHPQARRVEATLLAKAHRQTATQLRATAPRAVLAADPAAAAERHQTARAGRFVSAPCPEPEGVASLLIRLPADDVAALWTHRHRRPPYLHPG